MAINTFTIILREAKMLSANVKHFTFECAEKTVFEYIPGQFITLHILHQDKLLRRSYSIASSPRQSNLIEFAAGYVEHGPASELLFHLQPGDTLQATGPFGRLILKEDQHFQRYIFIATSTGVTPFRAMMNELIHKMNHQPNIEILLLQGVQYRDDLLYKDEFQDLQKKYSQFKFYPCLSREPKDTLLNSEFSGYVQHLLQQFTLKPEQDIIYLCGNPAMIDDAFQMLKDKGFQSPSIIREKYISS